jgi:hypothetical protein
MRWYGIGLGILTNSLSSLEARNCDLVNYFRSDEYSYRNYASVGTVSEFSWIVQVRLGSARNCRNYDVCLVPLVICAAAALGVVTEYSSFDNGPVSIN